MRNNSKESQESLYEDDLRARELQDEEVSVCFLRSRISCLQALINFNTNLHTLQDYRHLVQGLNSAFMRGYQSAFYLPEGRRYELTVGCWHLFKLQAFGKCSPMVGIFERDHGGNYALINHTEWIKEDHDPVFSKPLVVKVHEHRDIDKEFRHVNFISLIAYPLKETPSDENGYVKTVHLRLIVWDVTGAEKFQRSMPKVIPIILATE